MRIDYVPLEEVKAWPRNPKLHDLSTLGDSVRRFGFIQPLLIDERSGQLVAGHGRLETLLKMQSEGSDPPDRVKKKGKSWLLPVIRGISFENDREAEAYLLADN
jgi:hypothetical protein